MNARDIHLLFKFIIIVNKKKNLKQVEKKYSIKTTQCSLRLNLMNTIHYQYITTSNPLWLRMEVFSGLKRQIFH